MKTTPALSILFGAFLTGCTGLNPTRIVGNTLGAAGGAAAGHAIGKGKPLLTAIGAGAGTLLSETLHARSTATADKSYAAGYEQARSDSAKRRYRTLADRQRLTPAADDAAHLRLFEVPLPEREVDGVILAPGTTTIRIQE
jgi:hypothetical protein